MATKTDVFNLLFGWLKTESGMVVIKAPQDPKAPRPARPYASINFLNPSSRLGASIDQQKVVTTGPNQVVETAGMRKAVASINIFGENAVDTLAAVRDSLDRPDVQELFLRAGISHLDDSPIADLTALQETAYEERGQFDLTVAYVESSEVDVGTIDSVEMTGNVNGHSESLTVTQ